MLCGSYKESLQMVSKTRVILASENKKIVWFYSLCICYMLWGVSAPSFISPLQWLKH